MSTLCRLLSIVLLMMAFVGLSATNTYAADRSDMPVLVELQTNYGQITIKLFPDKAPETVKNFLRYVDEGFYANTIFHRVIPTFMIQGGGMTTDMKEKKTHKPIQNESGNGLHNTRGTVAMARTNDPNSATSQFFINVKDNPFLDKGYPNQKWGYCVFGQVVKGMGVVDDIKNVPTTTKNYHANVPVKPVIIKKAVRVKE